MNTRDSQQESRSLQRPAMPRFSRGAGAGAPTPGRVSTDPKVRHYYDAYDEWGRLAAPAGQFEFSRTMYLLNQHLPANSRVLDLGGGPGRYAIALARRNHRVVLADISPVQLDTAKRKIRATELPAALESIDEVDATDLHRYSDESFDAVIALGPFYHLTTEQQRITAAAEIARVTRPGGLVYVAFMPPLVGVTGLIDRVVADEQQVAPDAYQKALVEGRFENRTNRGFQAGWYGRPEQVEAVFGDAGYERLDLVSVRGIAYGREEAVLKLRATHPDQFAGIMQALQESARDTSVIATCGHVLYIGKKRE